MSDEDVSPDDSSDHQPREQPNNPLHGVKLVDILEHLVEKYGWEAVSYTHLTLPTKA